MIDDIRPGTEIKAELKLEKKYYILSGAIVLAIFLMAYRPTMFNFLTVDDFWTLGWVHEAVQHPNLLLEEYILPWQIRSGHTIAPCAMEFYRPIFGTVMSLEYKFFGNNGLYFRLVNIMTEMLSGLMLSLVILSLNKKLIHQAGILNKQLLSWSLFSASLFIICPLHSEPINYVSDILDPLVVSLSLFSFWCYIRWCNSTKRALFILSIGSAILAFLTKETAVVLPPTIFIYELFLGQDAIKTIDSTKLSPTKFSLNCIRRLCHSFMLTLPYWLIFIPYFYWRKIVLGDFIAGYPDRSYYPTIGWLTGLHDIFVPINTTIIGTHSPVFKIWHIILAIIVLLNVLAAVKTNRSGQRILYFLTIWFILALAPFFKIFPTQMSCGSGSRFAYLATVPLCALLTYGPAMLSFGNQFRYLIRFIALVFFGITAIILYSNNLGWAAAGNWTNKVVQELRNYYQKIKDDPLVYISGLPTSYKNIDCIGQLNRVTRRPMMDRDINNCARVHNYGRDTSPGLLKQAATNNKRQIHLLYWDVISEKLKPVNIPSQNRMSERKWQGDTLKQIIRVFPLPSIPAPRLHWLNDGTLELVSNTPNINYSAIELNLPEIPCWNIDCLALKIQFDRNQDFTVFNQANLLFTNNLVKDYSPDSSLVNSCCSNIKSTNEEQEIIFPLRNIAAWTMGGNCFNIRILLPIAHSLKISEILIPKTETLIPCISLKQSINDPIGQIQIDNKALCTQNIQYDAHLIKGASQAILEVIPASQSFENMDFHNNSKVFFLKKNLRACAGQFTINRTDLPNIAAYYKARILILDKLNNQIGFPSDTFFIFINL